MGHAEHLKILLEFGGNADLEGPSQVRVLHRAAAFDSHECIRVLLDAGANPHVYAGIGLTPAAFAARGKHLTSIKAFREAGGNALLSLGDRDRSPEGLTPFHYAINVGDINIFRYLVFEVGWGEVKR